ncbi:MAG: hypothetical protein HYT79_12300 [Elusimicrobia bacterium]|nr:hypothetical protein [Elusimicrobiota bacterium]
MNPGQIILNIVIMSVGVVFMAFTKKCFTGLCFMTYFSLMGGMLAVYGFIETLSDLAVLNKCA